MDESKTVARSFEDGEIHSVIDLNGYQLQNVDKVVEQRVSEALASGTLDVEDEKAKIIEEAEKEANKIIRKANDRVQHILDEDLRRSREKVNKISIQNAAKADLEVSKMLADVNERRQREEKKITDLQRNYNEKLSVATKHIEEKRREYRLLTEDIANMEVVRDEKAAERAKELTEEFEITENMLKRWGYNESFSKKDYLLLEDHFALLQEANGNMTADQISVAITLCNFYRLRVRAFESGKVKEAKDSTQAYDDIQQMVI